MIESPFAPLFIARRISSVWKKVESSVKANFFPLGGKVLCVKDRLPRDAQSNPMPKAVRVSRITGSGLHFTAELDENYLKY